MFSRALPSLTVVAASLLLSLTAPAVAADLKVHGSSTVAGGVLVPNKAAIEKETGLTLTIVANGSGNGLKDLADGKADMAMISAPLVEEADTLNKKAPGSLKIEGLLEFPIGLFATRIIVNAKNPVKALSEGQIKDIFAGKITSWKDVGGPDLAIVVVAEGPGSGGRTLMESRLLGGAAMTDKVQAVQTVGQVAETVGQNAAAIGYGNPATITSAVNAIPGSEVYQPLILVTKGTPSADAKKLIETAKKFVTKSSSLQTLALR
jgi:phosphate transport system substrate-binding protein